MSSQGARKKARKDFDEKPQTSSQAFRARQIAHTQSLEKQLADLQAQLSALSLSMKEQIAERKKLDEEQALIQEFLTAAVAQMPASSSADIMSLAEDPDLIDNFIELEKPDDPVSPSNYKFKS